MKLKNKFKFILPLIAISLASCTKSAKDLIVTGDYYLNEETPITLKNPNFKTTYPDKYRLELIYFHLNITEITLDEYLEYEEQNEKGINKTTIFKPTYEYVYYKASFNMQFKLYLYESEEDLNPTVKSISPEKDKDIFGTYIGRYNRTINTYYFLLDQLDPCYEDSSQSGESSPTCLLLVLTIDNPEYVIVRLSSKKGELYSNDRWHRSFPLEYQF